MIHRAHRRLLAALLIAAAPRAAAAQAPAQAAPPAKTPPVIKFTGDVGYVSTSGNSSVQTLNLGDRVTAKVGVLTLSQQFSVVHGRSKGKTVTSLWRASVRGDYALEQTFGLYSSVNYERNVFAGLASRVGTVAGLTAQVVNDARNKLSVEGGISLTAQRAVDPTKPDQDFLGGRAATAFVRRIGAKASIAQSVELLPNFRESEDLRINSESTLVAPITKEIGVKLSFVIRYDGLPQTGYLTTDRLFTSGIQITL